MYLHEASPVYVHISFTVSNYLWCLKPKTIITELLLCVVCVCVCVCVLCVCLQEARVQSTLLQGNAELREIILADEREKLERENASILREKLDSLKLEIEEEKAELQVSIASHWKALRS